MSDSTANTDMKRCAASALAKAAQDGRVLLSLHSNITHNYVLNIILWYKIAGNTQIMIEYASVCTTIFATCVSLSQSEVNRKILHEQSVEKTFIQLLTHSVSH